MNLLGIKTSVANYFGKSLAELTILSQDQFLVAANQVRRFAELENDFEHTRRLVTVSVDRESGGSLSSATASGAGASALLATGVTSPTTAGTYTKQNGFVNGKPWYTKIGATSATSYIIFYTSADSSWNLCVWSDFPDFDANGGKFSRASGATPIGDLEGSLGYSGTTTISAVNDWRAVKSVIEVGVFDDQDNLRPVTWTTVAESLERQRKERRFQPRYPTDEQASGAVRAASRVDFSGDNVYLFPLPTEPGDPVPLGIECYTFRRDWTADDLSALLEGDEWTNNGEQFLMWGVIVHLNHLFKEFVFRQEGNLPPPTDLRNEGLAGFMAWDAHKYEQNRRHSR